MINSRRINYRTNVNSRGNNNSTNSNGGNISVEEMERSVCFVCATEHPPLWAIGECSHRVCSLCSLRMRDLYTDNRCVMCKMPSERVIIVRAIGATNGGDTAHEHTKSFEDLFRDGLPRLERLGMYFMDKDIRDQVLKPTVMACPIPSCPEGALIFGSKTELKKHVNRAHSLTFCDICLMHKKVFPAEYHAYTRTELNKHQRSSESGHPSCELCGTLFYSEDELAHHRRDRHEQCHLCRRLNPHRPLYYRDYGELEEHFRKEHFLCPEPICLDLKFVVFADELEYKAHQVEMHLGGVKMQRSAQNQLRRIEFSPAARPSSISRPDANRRGERDRQRGGRRGGRTAEAVEETINVVEGRKAVESPPIQSTPLSKTLVNNLFYGEAIGDLAQRLQSLNLYEQRNVDFCASLIADYHLSESTANNIKGLCRHFQQGKMRAVDLVAKLAAILGQQRLERIGPTLVELQLDTHKRMQLNTALTDYVAKLTAFPELSVSVSVSVEDRLGGSNGVNNPVPSRIANQTPTRGSVIRIKPQSIRTKNDGLAVDPSKNPLSLLAVNIRSTASLSPSSSNKPLSSKKQSTPPLPPSFIQAVAAPSTTGIVGDDSKEKLRPVLDDAEFPSLLPSSRPQTTDEHPINPLNVFTAGQNRNVPETFTIGDSSLSSQTDSLTDPSGSHNASSSTASKKKSKKGQVIMRYGQGTLF